MIDLARLISNPAALDSQMSPVKQRIQDLEDRVQATERKLNGRSRPPSAHHRPQTIKQLDRHHMVSRPKDEASFKFLAGEFTLSGSQSEWVVTGKGKTDPDGILSNRPTALRPMRNQHAKTPAETWWQKISRTEMGDTSLNLIAEVVENKGLFGKDMLYFTLKPATPTYRRSL